MKVLEEVQNMICESVGLPPNTNLEGQDPDVLSQVPTSLLEALEVCAMSLVFKIYRHLKPIYCTR
jgi:hypothetical protein